MKIHGQKHSHSFREECAVFGIWNHPEASRLTYLGLYALQHRGQEASGISSLHEGLHILHKGHGLVADVFDEEALDSLKGMAAIGHNRYSTTGANEKYNIQPLRANLYNGPISLAHNGNIINSNPLRNELKKMGSIFNGTNDTEIFLHLIAKNPSNDIITCLKEELPKLEGAYSMVMITDKQMIAARDPHGFRPLVLGELVIDGRKSKVLSSESCAFDLIGAKMIREIKPGEIYCCDNDSEASFFMDNIPNKKSQCVFEHVYFARPDSIIFGESVYETRKKLGAYLAKEDGPMDVDLVIPVPDSGVPSALGYSQASGIPFELGIIRNHYVGRTFIEPKQSIRNFGVKVKLNPQEAILRGKKVVVIDDSLVRGTTSRKIINLVRNFGAKEVHMRIAAPPTIGPCYYGVDTPDKEELIASQKSIEEIRKFIGADSLKYVSLEGLLSAVKDPQQQKYCAACFTDQYPTKVY
jgi:amidophosphoribosyltransferase